MWKLLKMLPGQRIAGAGWITTARKRLEAKTYETCQALPQFCYDRRRKALLELLMVLPSMEIDLRLLVADCVVFSECSAFC